jgi:hypothetical protein
MLCVQTLSMAAIRARPSLSLWLFLLLSALQVFNTLAMTFPRPVIALIHIGARQLPSSTVRLTAYAQPRYLPLPTAS